MTESALHAVSTTLYDVAVERGDAIISHLPWTVSTVCHLFLWGEGSIPADFGSFK